MQKLANHKRFFFVVLGVAVAIWLVFGMVDFIRVSDAEEPIFCTKKTIHVEADNYTTNRYTGLGYSFILKGYFSMEDPCPGIREGQRYLLGRELVTLLWE